MLWFLLLVIGVPLLLFSGFIGAFCAFVYAGCRAAIFFSRCTNALKKRSNPAPRPGPLAGYYLPQSHAQVERLADREFLTSLGVTWDRTAPADRDRRRLARGRC